MLTGRNIHYKRNILISIIISEAVMIAAFVFSPKESAPVKNILFREPAILIDEVPITVQSLPRQIPKPETPAIRIGDNIEEFEPLDDIRLNSNLTDQDDNSATPGPDQDNNHPAVTAPRLIYEVVPAGGENKFNGLLRLSLKINEDGRVVDHRILFNSLDCTDCLTEIIKAAYSSKWEPAMVSGKNEEHWVEKTYTFN